MSVLATRAGAAPPSGPVLLGTRWDGRAQPPVRWQHKENCEVTVLDEEGAKGRTKALRLTSKFKSADYTWTTWNFPPRSAEGAVHVTFRVRGDGSGHHLIVYLGAPSPTVPGRSLAYGHDRQPIAIDFEGWRQMSVDLEKLQTPAGGLRDRDLASVHYLQFMIHTKDKSKPLDIQIAQVEFTGYTAEEQALLARQARRRAELITQTKPAIARLRERLAGTREKLDSSAKAGKYVDVARVYWAALDWCVDDIERLLRAEELALVEQAPTLVDALERRLAEPGCVVGRVLDRKPEEPDTLRAGENPYFKAVVDGVRPMARKQRTWEKGRRGYKSIPNAWSFAGLGNDVYSIQWAMTRSRSPLRHHPVLAATALSLFDTIAHQHTEGDFNIDREAIYGRDGNINRFCLAPALDAWCELSGAYPDLLPPAWREDVEAGLKRLADYQVTDYGLARVNKRPDIKQPAYPNMDVHHILIMESAWRIWKDPQYAQERDAFINILDSAVYPMGAWTYINTQNECFVYHNLNVLFPARLWKLTGNPTVLAMLRRTIPFYPYNVEPAGMPESYTDPCWKHYWSGGSAPAPDVIASLFDDPLNKRVAEICASVWGYERGYHAAIAAEFWKPMASKPLPDGYVIDDLNVQGPRGRYGAWSFAGNGRNHTVGYQGKDTFVGAMLTDAQARPLPLDSALQVVTTEVRLNHTENHWRGGRCCSAREKLTSLTGPDFGSLAVRYQVSQPNWSYKEDVLYPWEGTQAWYLSRTRLVGLVTLEAMADETRAAVYGRVRLGMKRQIESLDAKTWKYGRLRIRIHEHNYARIVTRPSETFYLDKPENYRSTEITLLDPQSVAAGEKGTVTFKQGTRFHFLIEVYPDSSSPALEVQRIESSGATGFRIHEADRHIVLLHNPTAGPVDATVPVGPGKLTVYRDQPPSGKSDGGPIPTRIEPHRHWVAVVADR